MSALALASALISCTPKITTENPEKVLGIILPHHLLVEHFIDQFYTQFASRDVEHIILLSPNHFNYGYHYAQTTNQLFPTILNTPPLNLAWISTLSTHSPLAIEPKKFGKEHGITTHLFFLHHYFPQADVTPIILKTQTPQSVLDLLRDQLIQFDLSKTLIVASIDFTHYESEKIALENDNQTIEWLKSVQPQSFSLEDLTNLAHSPGEFSPDAVAMDSPESLYLLLKLLEAKQALHFSLWKRTSSTSLGDAKNPLDNTSHIFGIFQFLR
ncbi:MAG: capsule biosynthesis protein CapA [Candidatus Peregrinibacteria bacterium GW2011_GWF2_39_17]|nr:MAG: capsule biosynthesis protein CapA [Candidatus Peregrinibacteria bacterium GW2011_GWF2_39_17]